MTGLFKFITPYLIIRRNVGRKKYNWFEEGIQYPGFKYYPRVERIKPLKGVPYWEQHILKLFKLDGKTNRVAVIKNIPENNQRLWKVKHLIKIAPITYPDGFPEENDTTYLKENGELKVIKTIGVHNEKLQLAEAFKTDVKKLDGDTLRRNSRLKWLNGWE
ncbi:hypothetical protein NQ314_011922 [Rhamnusium bicolor]|uniref:Large ribosomal subunit protein uL30m n=1 Tax=Rhamnusium bicolor TaxID=1586634 RepID=A0AAV8XFP2_9CUCU|nr:hypothetical protein NQ314_011922 [Rhamnusium bicolor]